GEIAGDAVGRLSAFGDPGLGLFDVDDEALLVILGEQRVVGADLLDEAAIAGRTRVGDDDVVVRAVGGAAAGKTDFQGHEFYLSVSSSFRSDSGSGGAPSRWNGLGISTTKRSPSMPKLAPDE